MDKLDKRILSYLYKNPQMPFEEIAKKLGRSSFTIRMRYKKMKKNGIIQYSVVGIDLSKLGYQGTASMFIILFHNRDKIVTVSKILKIRNVYSVIEVVGPYDILATAAVKDLNGIRNIIYQIRKLPNVQRVEIAICNDTTFPLNPRYGEILSRKIIE